MQKKTIFKWLLTTEIVASVAVVVVIVTVPTAVIYSNKSTNETTEVASPIDNSANKYTVDSSTNQMSFAGYYNDTTSDGVGSSTDMNAIVNTITPNVTLSDTSTWVSSSETTSSNTTYTKYTLAIDSDFTYIKNFISVTDWYNETSASTLNAQLVTSDLDYDVLTDWNVSLVLNVYSDSSYEFVYSINPKSDDSTNDDSTATTSSTTDFSYQFILYTKYIFGTTFTNGNRGEAATTVPVDNFLGQYTVNSNSMTFAGYNQEGAGSKDEMNAIVTEITPTITDVTANTSSNVWTPGTDSSGNTTYTLIANSDGSYNNSADTTEDTYQYIENFIGVTSNWYNETSASTLNAQLASGDVDYDVLKNYIISLVLDTNSSDSSTYTSYTFTLSITSKDSSTTVSSYDFKLYTGTDFGTTFTNGNRGAAEVPVDNYSDKYYVGTDVDNVDNPQIRFASYYSTAQDQSTLEANMKTIVSTISPGVSDVTDDTTGTWTSETQSDNSIFYTLTKYNDGSSGADPYQYIKNFMNLRNSSVGWKNVDSSRNLSSTQLDESDLNYDSLSNYDISLQLIYYSATSYQFRLTITSKDSPTTTDGYRFTLYTYWTYNNNAGKF